MGLILGSPVLLTGSRTIPIHYVCPYFLLSSGLAFELLSILGFKVLGTINGGHRLPVVVQSSR